MKNKIGLKCLIWIIIISIILSSTVVASYEQNLNISIVSDENISWGVQAMGLDKYMEKLSNEGIDEEIKIAVIDTGINVNHEVFEGRLDLNPVYARNYITGSNDLTDTCGRGTAIASIIAESTPSNVKILPIKAVNTDIEEEAIEIERLDGIYNALKLVASEVDIICFSLVANPSLVDEIMLQGFVEMLDREIYNVSPDTVIINCVGDVLPTDVGSNVKFPANVDSIIAVTSVDSNKTIAENACFGPEVDFAAPGVNVKVASHLNNSGYRIDSSSVYAVAHLSSAYANIKSELKHLGLSTTQEDIMNILKNNSVDLGANGKDNYYGYGFVDFNSNMFGKTNVEVENKTNKKATVTFDSENSSNENFSAEVKNGTLSVTCNSPCYVLATTDNGVTYTTLNGIVSETNENKYDFEFELVEGIKIVVAIKGDINYTGTINNRDITALMNIYSTGITGLSTLEKIIFNLNNMGTINNRDITFLMNVYAGYDTVNW